MLACCWLLGETSIHRIKTWLLSVTNAVFIINKQIKMYFPTKPIFLEHISMITVAQILKTLKAVKSTPGYPHFSLAMSLWNMKDLKDSLFDTIDCSRLAQWTNFNGWTKWKSWNFLFCGTREYTEAGIEQATVAMRYLGTNSLEPCRRAVPRSDTSALRAEDQQLYNRKPLTSWAHCGSLSKRRELVLSSLYIVALRHHIEGPSLLSPLTMNISLIVLTVCAGVVGVALSMKMSLFLLFCPTYCFLFQIPSSCARVNWLFLY